MYYIIYKLVLADKRKHVITEGWHILQQFFLGDIVFRTGNRVDHSYTGRPVIDFRKRRMVFPGINVNVESGTCKMFREFGHVYVLATTVHATQSGQWGCMFTNERDFLFHDFFIALLLIGLPSFAGDESLL